ncbi:Neurogenic locus Notch protein [Schistosoma japonicum]|nr:Neurogenic locus Notch protein [Schistosoma japonicum]
MVFNFYLFAFQVLKAKIWYPSTDLIRSSRIMYNSPNNYKNSKFTDGTKKYLSSKLPMMEPQSTTTTTTTAYEEQINFANIKNKTVSEIEKCLDMLQGRACDNNTIPYYNTIAVDNKNFASPSSSPPPQSLRNHCNINNTFSDYRDLNEIPPTLIKYSAYTSTIPTCTSQSYFCHSSSPSKTQYNSYTPALTLTENDHNGSTSSTVTTTITLNGTNSFDDFDCQRNENFVHNYQTMQELYTFLNSISQSELNSFQKILHKVILDYYGSGELVEMINSCERQQQLYAASGQFQNTTENNNSDFNTVCYLLTQNDGLNTAHTMLHNSMNSMISWQMIYNSTHLHRLLNLRIPDTGETLLHISARFNQSKAINNLLNAGADFSTVDNQGRTTLFTAVSAGAIESVQAILNHPTSGLSPFCYLPNLLQDSTTPLIQAIKLGDTDIFNMLLHAMNVLVCALTKSTFSRSQEYTSYDMMIGTSNDLLHIHSTSSSAAASSSSPPTAVTTPTPAGTELNFEENTLNFLDINTSDSLGRTALHWAAVTDQSDIVHSLCNSGATLDAQTLHEETPLALACREGAVTSCRLLLLTGANLNLADYLDRTPRDLAYLGGHYDIVNLLDEYIAANSNTEYCTSGNLTKFNRKHDSLTSEILTTPTTPNTGFSSSRLSPTVAASMGQSYCSYFLTPQLCSNNNSQLTYRDTRSTTTITNTNSNTNNNNNLSLTHKPLIGNPSFPYHYSMLKSVVKSVNEGKGAKNRTARPASITTISTSRSLIVDGTVTTTLTTSSSQFSLVNELTTDTDTTFTTINCDHTPSLNLLNTTNDSNLIPSLIRDDYIRNMSNNDKRTLNSTQPKAFDNRQDHLKLYTNCKMVNNSNRNSSSGDIKAKVSNDNSLLKADYHFSDNITNSSNNTSTHIHTINPPNMGSDESESPNHWSSSSSDLSPNRMSNILQKFDEQQPPSSTIRGIHHSVDGTSNHYLMSKWKSCIAVNNNSSDNAYNRVIVNRTITNSTAYHKESFFTNCDQQYHFDGYNHHNHHHHQKR